MKFQNENGEIREMEWEEYVKMPFNSRWKLIDNTPKKSTKRRKEVDNHG